MAIPYITANSLSLSPHIHRMRALSTTTQLQSRPRPSGSAAVARQCRGRTPVVRVSQQQQEYGAATVTTSSAAQQEEVVTEKEEMSRKYNEQMQRQMGWNNPFEVWGLGLVVQRRGCASPPTPPHPSQHCPGSRTSAADEDPPAVAATPPPLLYPPCCSTTSTGACTCTRLCQVWAAARVLPAGAAIASACRPSPAGVGLRRVQGCCRGRAPLRSVLIHQTCLKEEQTDPTTTATADTLPAVPCARLTAQGCSVARSPATLKRLRTSQTTTAWMSS